MTMRRTQHLTEFQKANSILRAVCVFRARLSPPLLTPALGQAPQALPPSPAGRPAVHLTISVKHSPLWEGSTGYKKQK